MSQVIVTDDKLNDKRQRSREQERRIQSETQFARWRRSDVTGPDPVAKAIGLAAAPIVAIWAVLTGLIALVMFVCREAFRFVGGLVGGKRSLITGEPADSKR